LSLRDERVLYGQQVCNLVLERRSITERRMVDDQTFRAAAPEPFDEMEDSQRLRSPAFACVLLPSRLVGAD
jgi:hypothetical protein